MFRSRDLYAEFTVPAHAVDGGTGWVRTSSRWMLYKPTTAVHHYVIRALR